MPSSARSERTPGGLHSGEASHVVVVRPEDLPRWRSCGSPAGAARRVSPLYFGAGKRVVLRAVALAEAAAATAAAAARDARVDRLWRAYESEARVAAGTELTESYYAAAAAFSAYVAATGGPAAVTAVTCANDAAEQAWRATARRRRPPPRPPPG